MTSAIRGTADSLCSLRAFPSLTDTVIHQRRLTPLCGGHAPTAAVQNDRELARDSNPSGAHCGKTWAVIAICTAMMIAEISRWSLVWIGCVSRRTCLV
jgi:hypothetical protein